LAASALTSGAGCLYEALRVRRPRPARTTGRLGAWLRGLLKTFHQKVVADDGV